MTKGLDQLRQVAKRATPGPWARKGTAVLGPREPWDLGTGPARIIAAQMPWQRDRMEANAEHVATFDPPTVLALIDRAEAAEAAVSNQRSVVKTLAERNVELTKFKDAYSLQAQELEQAEAERDFRQKENKELFEQIERVRELASEYRKTIPEEVLHSVMVDIRRALDGGEPNE
ncbi:ead/Ea22-like family protein [Glutamicibacter sp. V16R2B1]|uniref:ead/Ea22-like family protein n=1 Tax=Glutamicibacter sp. V16R2B1 TaxID=2036207 RepID=UPI0010FD780E|nr:ead/Ea22-like family protein [Glutamicibacter sp. V16R2B1]TLK56296.1 hypothetical protein FDN03_02265 [Glutamicibacter sp. V16R2B1]